MTLTDHCVCSILQLQVVSTQRLWAVVSCQCKNGSYCQCLRQLDRTPPSYIHPSREMAIYVGAQVTCGCQDWIVRRLKLQAEGVRGRRPACHRHRGS